jgi:hypothetical protein
MRLTCRAIKIDVLTTETVVGQRQAGVPIGLLIAKAHNNKNFKYQKRSEVPDKTAFRGAARAINSYISVKFSSSE